MQIKHAIFFLAALRGAVATLPETFELLVFRDGQRIGCVNGYGKFVTSGIACYLFRAQSIDGSENKNIWASGYGTCSADSNVIECYEPKGAPAVFTQRGADLELVGSGTTFSADLEPDSSDRMGVDIIVGEGGIETFFLQVHALSG
ncbi:hypothetical protein F4779DRAFT_200032 [Xylariaceae sp. FL0662B]|nr:hypothetical protein F4779DRAFT_200032 [Xylariaceae sp. FL0662B]